MPNWCDNHLRIYASDVADLSEFRDKVLSANKRSILEGLLPLPEEFGEDSHWRAWTDENWGCKWSDHETNVDVPLTWPFIGDDGQLCEGWIDYFFQTPWCPPEAGMTRISAMFPKLTFVLGYVEEGVGYCGASSFAEGERLSEFCIDADSIPEVAELIRLGQDDADGTNWELISEIVYDKSKQAMDLVRF